MQIFNFCMVLGHNLHVSAKFLRLNGSGDIASITGSALALHCCKAHAKIKRKMGNSTPPYWIHCTQRSGIVGLYHCEKFGLNRLSSFDNIKV